MAPRETEVDLLKRLSNENLNRVICKHSSLFFAMVVKNVERMRQQDRKLFLVVRFDGFNALARAAAANTTQELQVLIDSQCMTCGSVPVTDEVIDKIGSESIRTKLAAISTETMFALFEAVIQFPSESQTLVMSVIFTPCLMTVVQ